MKNLFLIRHGQSMQNTGENNKELLPDHKVYLTEKGKIQAFKAAICLKDYCLVKGIDLSTAKLYVSPYQRTRETADIINELLKISNVQEDYLLIEHQYGLFSDRKWTDNKKFYPDEFEYYDKFYKNEGKFYVKFPMGESPMDVAIRTRMFLQELKKQDIDNVFIVSHGTTLKTIVMNIFGYSPEWYANTPTFNNCEVRVIDEDKKMKTLRK